MTTFEDRKNAFETKFAHDEEMKFKAEARANKLLGLWAADLLGKTGDAAKAYGLDVIKIDFQSPGHEDVISKVVTDLDGKADEATVRAKRVELLSGAMAAMIAEN